MPVFTLRFGALDEVVLTIDGGPTAVSWGSDSELVDLGHVLEDWASDVAGTPVELTRVTTPYDGPREVTVTP